MTEENFNCLSCGIKIGYAGQHNKTCVLKCFDVYTDETLEKIYKFIDRLKQKSYQEGYEKANDETLKNIHPFIGELKKCWIEEGRRQVLAELNKKELEK